MQDSGWGQLQMAGAGSWMGHTQQERRTDHLQQLQVIMFEHYACKATASRAELEVSSFKSEGSKSKPRYHCSCLSALIPQHQAIPHRHCAEPRPQHVLVRVCQLAP